MEIRGKESMRTRFALIGAGLVISGLVAASAAGAQGDQPTFGRMSDEAFLVPAPGRHGMAAGKAQPHGVDMAKIPDFVETTDRGGLLVGYVKKTDLFPIDGQVVLMPKVQPVYTRDGKTVVGAMYPDRGFVRAGQDPGAVPTVPTTVATRR